ncbi:MAG TPA: molybdenum cofactor biosynthesis protein MoaE [Gemmatimonadaceae bacterium]|nr:molybdenum cofactor biosynthesis protein MoaE [Gemmatimonadaceae bacterium]
MIRVAIVGERIDPQALLSEVTTAGTGATTLFLGTVREVNEGRAVTGIEYSAYTAMAHDELVRIAEEAVERFGGIRIVIEHRIGTLTLQEVSVAIAVAHARRAPALDAQRFAIEELKRRVPIWKREQYADGDRHWVDPTAPLAPGAVG